MMGEETALNLRSNVFSLQALQEQLHTSKCSFS